MTLLFIDGFDAQDLASKWLALNNGAGTASFTSSTRFGTGYGFTLGGSGASSYGYIKQFTASSQVFVGAAVKSSAPAGQNYGPTFHVLAGDNASTWHLFLVTTNLGAVQLWRGDGHTATDGGTFHWAPSGTMLAASANGVMDASWHYVELGATINSSTGTAVVKVDNTQVISFTGNTKNGGTASSVDTVGYFYLQYSTFSAISPGAPVVDDLYVCNALGGTNNNFLGDCRVQTLLPTGAGSSTQLTPTGSGSNYLNAADVPDATGTFNSSATSGQRDTYALADLAAATTGVLGVQQVMHAFKTDAGAANLKAAQKSGATVSYGATQSLGTSMACYTDLFETNPATSAAWTTGAVNALEAGAEIA